MGLFDKFFGGLGKTRQNIDLEELFQGYAPDSEEFYENLEEMLILADAGMPVAERVDYLMRRKTWEDRYRKGDEAREGLIKILDGLLDVGSPASWCRMAKRSCSVPATPFVQLLPNSSVSGPSAPAVTLSATKRAAIPPQLCMTGSVRPKPAAPMLF